MRKLTVLGGLAVVLLLVLAGGTMSQQAAAGPNDLTLSFTGLGRGNSVTYSIVVNNPGTSAVGDIYVAAVIPEGSTSPTVVTTPAGAASMGVQGNIMAWVVSAIPAKGSITFSYRVTAPDGAGPANAYVAWKTPTAGSLVSPSVTYKTAMETNAARRGCMACHYSVTLARESERGGPNHPKIANDADVNVCLGCHKAAADRTGMAPKMLRTIVHSAHMNSESFTGRYKGNCFTCHDVDEAGNLVLLYEKVELNKWNVPANVNAKGYIANGQAIADVR